MNSTQLTGTMKHFVKGSDDRKSGSLKDDDSKLKSRAVFLSGSHVKQFYETVMGKEAFKVSDIKNKLENREKSCKKQKCTIDSRVVFHGQQQRFNINTLMKAVETGNVKDAGKILDANGDKVNNTDEFGWTPLMSACCAGNREMVQLLLKCHPDLSVRDKRGHTCRQLASAKGHIHILDTLDKYTQEMKKPTEQPSSSILESFPKTPFYCKTCKQSIENISVKKHLLSTVHNFNAASKKKMPTMYGIPESNKGFQILLRSGWDKETGLGPCGEGHKFPPKTVLKQDRTGLGAKRYKPRVTHTLDAVEEARREAKPKETFKRKLKSQKRREQRLERNLREMLS